jgi:ribosome-associated toxin RatA of RatAB toxin-antitoxin module
VAIRESREVVVDSEPESILAVLADVAALPTWSAIHERVEVINRYEDGRPRHAEITIKNHGIRDRHVVEYHWGSDWMVWDATRTNRQKAQHGEYHLTREGGRTRVRFDLVFEPVGVLPPVLFKRGAQAVINSATEGLRNRLAQLKENT